METARLRCSIVFAVALLSGVLELVWAAPALAQPRPGASPAAPAAPAAQAEPQKDSLGRDTPRGTLLGFMNAARKEADEVLPQYLNTQLKDKAAADLAHKLYVVLDNRLPARLHELSDKPEGSLANPLKPDQDVVGTIATANGPLEVMLERTTLRSANGPVWLFSRKTLEAIPEVFDEIDVVSIDRFVPRFLGKLRFGGIRLFEWLVLLILVPLLYQAIGLLSRPLAPVIALVSRRFAFLHGHVPANKLPGFLRLLLLAIAIRWLLTGLELPLLERQFWFAVSTFFTIIAVVWLLLIVDARGELYFRRRFVGTALGDYAPLLRLARRLADGIVIAAGALVALRFLGVDPTAALAGLGIGGIAVALAAQKTLENIVGGLSLIFDKAVRVGDALKLGDTVGTVDFIGLRSTRIRTLDRTILTVPNGQIATANIETLSVRDKYWFHHVVGLTYETKPAQMRAVIEGIESLLTSHPNVDRSSIRARFIRLGSFSLDIEVFAYVFAQDWEPFLALQQELLLRIMETIEKAGASIAFPSQTLHLADPWPSAGALPIGAARAARLPSPRDSAEPAAALPDLTAQTTRSRTQGES